MTELVCERCRESVADAAKNCPHCGYNPIAEAKQSVKWTGRIGALLCLTVIGVPLGIPMVFSAKRTVRKAKKRGVGVKP